MIVKITDNKDLVFRELNKTCSYYAVFPPSIVIISPLTYEELSLQRNTTTSATSDNFPIL